MECTKLKELVDARIRYRAERVNMLLTQGLESLSELQREKFEHDELEALWLILRHREEHDGCSWA